MRDYLEDLRSTRNALLETPGLFTVEADPGCAGRLILTTPGGTRAEVDLRTVIWSKDAPEMSATYTRWGK